jgi:hypothetical protein
MSWVQLPVKVSDFDAVVKFCSRLLGAAPGKLRPGYANFALDVEVGSAGDVTHAEARLATAGLATQPEPGATCCYARRDKVRADDPDGLAWEYHTVLEHIETP